MIELRKPDRVPFMPMVHYYVAKHAGVTFQEAKVDLDKLEAAVEKTVKGLQLDSCLDANKVNVMAMAEAVREYGVY